MKNENGIEKSAILKGRTKYRDIDTGEILEVFEAFALICSTMKVFYFQMKNTLDCLF